MSARAFALTTYKAQRTGRHIGDHARSLKTTISNWELSCREVPRLLDSEAF